MNIKQLLEVDFLISREFPALSLGKCFEQLCPRLVIDVSCRICPSSIDGRSFTIRSLTMPAASRARLFKTVIFLNPWSLVHFWIAIPCFELLV